MSGPDRRAGDQLLDALEPVAERLFTAGGGGVRQVRSDEYDRIKRAIFGHPAYAGHAHELAGFDGIGAHHAP